MGGISTLRAVALPAIAAGLGIGATQVSSIISRNAEKAAKAEAAHEGREYKPTSDFKLNLDGGVRAASTLTGLLAIPAAGVAFLKGKPSAGAGLLGASGALLGGALLTRPKSESNGESRDIRGIIKDNLVSMGSTINAGIYAAFPSSNPRFENSTPLRGAKSELGTGTGEKPSAEAIRNAELRYLPGEVDHEAAKREADAALARIDFSKPNITVWVPGTGAHWIADSFKDAHAKSFGEDGSLAHIDYPATINFGPSVATGMETLRLVLAGIAERGGDHKVSLIGHSQGAWVAGDLMQTPEIYDMVDRTMLFGNPGMAIAHYTDRKDPKVMEINDSGDPITYPVALSEDFKSGVDLIESGDKLGGARELLPVAIRNPAQVSYLAAKYLQPQRWSGDRDPHYYDELFPKAADWLSKAPTIKQPAN